MLTRPIIDGKVYTRLTREGFKGDRNITIAKLYKESTAYVTKLVDVALGNEMSAITKKIADVQPSDWPQIAYFNMYRNKYRMEGLQPVSQTTREPQFQPSAPAADDDPFTVK